MTGLLLGRNRAGHKPFGNTAAVDRALAGCRIYPRAGEGQCMNRIAQRLPPDQSGFTIEKLPATQRGSAPASADAPSELSGVRRKTTSPAADDTANGAGKTSN